MRPTPSERWRRRRRAVVIECHCEEEPEGKDRRRRKVAAWGGLLERKQVGKRKGGRQAWKERATAGVGNPPLHLLVIYSFMFSSPGELIGFLTLAFLCFQAPRNPKESKWWEY